MPAKRLATKGTRHGNGAGYGGPAKGAGSKAAKVDFDAATNSQGHNQMTTADEGNEQALWRRQAAGLMPVLLEVANDPTRGASQIKAIETFQNRVWGTPKATMTLEGDAQRPAFVFIGVPEKESSEAWAKANPPA